MKLSNKYKSHFRNKYGKWVVITGASSGIGLALAERLAETGLNLIINSRNKQILEKKADKLSSEYNVEVIPCAGDLSTTEGIEKVIAAAKGKEIGLFIPSAGFGTSGSFINSSLQEEINMLRVNAEAVLSLTHYFSQIFVRQKRGGIIFLSSIVAFQGVPYASNYAATKAYIQSFAEALSIELKPYGIDILAAAPAPVDTGFGKRADMRLNSAMNPKDIAVPILKALGKRTTVLPGFLSKLLSYSLKTVPRWAKVRIMKTVMAGFTKHQRDSE
jgi:short-subunit dehydrogenase